MRKFSAVTLEHRPVIVNDTASVTEACNQMRDRRAGATLVVTRKTSRLVLHRSRRGVPGSGATSGPLHHLPR
jgi:hypothetical protein